MIKDYLNISYTFLKNRRLRSFLTMIGILIGIAAVISLIGLGEGLRETIVSQFDMLSADIITIQASGLNQGPPGEGVVNPLRDAYIDDIETLPGIDMAIGRNIENSKISFEGGSDFTWVGSMPDGKRRKEVERITQLEVEKGRMLRDKDTNVVVLGSNYGKSEALGKAVQIRDKVIVNGKTFKVVGILKKKGSFITDNIILMNEDVMINLFDIGDTVSMIVVKVGKGYDLGIVKGRIEKYLRKERDVDEGKEDFGVESAEQSVENLNSTLFAVQIFVYVIAGISIIVGGIGISNTMYTSVIERTRQIGVMKSIGAKNRNIFVLFLIESGLLGFVGGVIGILFGAGIAYGLAYVGQVALGTDIIRVSISGVLIIGTLLFSFLIGTMAGVLPALQASKLKPVDALRHTV